MDLIAELERTKAETLRHFEADREALAKRYAPGKWDVRYLLHHLADAETVLFDRIRRVLSRPGQVIWAFDQDAWAHGLGYEERPLTLSRDLYAATRGSVIYYASRDYESKGALRFVHSETGLRTLADEFEKVAWHNQHHLDQIERALAN